MKLILSYSNEYKFLGLMIIPYLKPQLKHEKLFLFILKYDNDQFFNEYTDLTLFCTMGYRFHLLHNYAYHEK